MDSLRQALGYQGDRSSSVDEESGILHDIGEATRLSWGTRIKLFITCFVIGIVLSIFGGIFLFFGPHFLPSFAACYTLGNIFNIGSTCFLMGPMKQLKKMFESKRLISTIIVICSFVLTLLAAFWVKNAALALVMICIQSLAMTWYSISYIPYAQDCVSKTIGSFIS